MWLRQNKEFTLLRRFAQGLNHRPLNRVIVFSKSSHQMQKPREAGASQGFLGNQNDLEAVNDFSSTIVARPTSTTLLRTIIIVNI